MIPAHWEKCQLKTVAKIQTCIAKGKKDVKNPIELPYLRVANVQDGYLDLQEIKKIIVPKDQVNRYLLQKGDVVLTEGGDFDKLGRGTVWHGQIQPCLHQNHVFVVHTKSTILLPEFFSYQAASLYGKKYFLSCAKQTTNLASINSTQLSEFPVLLPPIPEQKRIVEILATWDKAIALTERSLEVKQKQYALLLEKLLEGGSTWDTFQLRELIDLKHGYAFSSNYFSDIETDKILLTPGNFHVDGYLYFGANTKYYFGETSEEFRLSNGDLLIVITDLTKDMNILGNAVILHSDKTVLHNQRIGKVLIKDESKVDKEFLCLSLNSKSCKKHIKETATGSTVRHTSSKEILKLTVSVPSITTQKNIANALKSAAQEIQLIKKYCDLLKAQKRGLMQKLLTGEWRVAIQEAA